jgi:hypothetical protein
MRRPTKNFVIDSLAFTGFVLLTTTGVLMRYVLPPGSGHSRVIWGLDRHGWGSVHFWISLVLLGTLAIHLVLHWRWIVSLMSGKPREGSGPRLALGIIGLAGLLALSVAPLLSPVETSPDRENTRSSLSPRTHEEFQLLGSMSLYEVEEKTGVPAEFIIERLGLPPETNHDERLGKLRKTHKFTMDEVRDIVREHKRSNKSSAMPE